MIKKIGLIALGVFLVFCGMGMIEMGITDPELQNGGNIFSGFCGLIFILGGIAVAWMNIGEIRSIYQARKKKAAAQIAGEVMGAVTTTFDVVNTDRNELESLIRAFRKDYGTFFSHHGITANEEIQKEATQLYWHTLFLQKNRLDSKGIVLNLESDRYQYGSVAPVREESFFDGRYAIKDVSETVSAKKTFVSDKGKKIHSQKYAQSANYRILSAANKPNTNEKIPCPNCGNAATREDLIDGCDYCGTKFTVEDLGERVSEFGFRNDYQVAYAKYTEARKTYAVRAAVIIGAIIFLYFLIIGIIYIPQIDWGEGSPYTLRIAAVMFMIAFPVAGFTFIFWYMFMLFVFPLIQLKASAQYLGGFALKHIRNQNQRNTAIVNSIKSFDKFFSWDGFCSNIHNKLSVIHFAQGGNEAAAFVESGNAEAQMNAVIPSYQDLIDMQIREIVLDGYQAGEYVQEIGVTVKLQLLAERNGKAKKRKETVKLWLVKDSACKTQAVCAPSFTYCKQCGAPMSLLAGRTCQYCGHARRLAEYDWAIRAYQVIK
ncbi:MAG: hypothetical protein J5379_08425 [Clostridiales bacterium]|nr:hypothetical protein [Clostridiales bacterium]